MKVEMRVLRESPFDLEVECAPASLELEDDVFRFAGPVRGAVRFSLLPGGKVMALGRLETPVETECVRCLKPLKLTVRAPVDVLYEAREEEARPDEIVFGTGEDGRGAIFDGEKIRPAQQLREAVMMELPGFPMCRADCRGLCPNCGADRNEGPCACDQRDADAPAWKQSLKGLKLD